MSLDAIGIVSKNIEQTISFYKLFGVELKQVGGPDHYEGITPSGLRIMVDTLELIKEINPDFSESAGSNVVLCFKQNNPNDVNQLFTKIVESRFKEVKAPWDAFWGQRYASVQDPNGIQVDIFADLE